MDLLFAKALGDTALVRTRACDDPRKGKGVFALVDLHDGEVVLRDSPVALVPSVELSEAAIDDDKDLPPSVMDTCATCGGVSRGHVYIHHSGVNPTSRTV